MPRDGRDESAAFRKHRAAVGWIRSRSPFRGAPSVGTSAELIWFQPFATDLAPSLDAGSERSSPDGAHGQWRKIPPRVADLTK